MRSIRSVLALAAMAALVGCNSKEKTPEVAPKAPLKIAYSDWPGWTAFEIAIQKGWFKEAGVDVEFAWFEYAPSMEAFTAGKVDAVTIASCDALVTGAQSGKNIAILATDFSNGNDMIVAKPGIKSVKDLKDKKVGLEVGFVEHLLLLKGLEMNGMTESDVTLVNTPTHQTAQVLATPDVDAIAAWQPNSGQALKSVPGATAVFTSADAPGLIYDFLSVSPQSLAERREDWVKVVKVWDRVVAYLADSTTRMDGISLMAARVGVPAEEYAKFLDGTRFLTNKEALGRFQTGTDLSSIPYSLAVSDSFNVKNKVYTASQPVAAYLDSTLLVEALK
jgi:NitT/TauT family transport system substrate-binding protein